MHLNDTAYRNCKDLADKLAEEMGLTPLKWREAVARNRRRVKTDIAFDHKALTNAERNIAKRDETGSASWKDALRQAIDEAKTVATNRYEFEQYLAENFGVTMPRNTAKTVTFVHPAVGETKAVRGAKLGGLYTAYKIDMALAENKEKLLETQERSVTNARLFTTTEYPDSEADLSTTSDPIPVDAIPGATTRPHDATISSQRYGEKGHANRAVARSVSDISAELRSLDEGVGHIAKGVPLRSTKVHDGNDRPSLQDGTECGVSHGADDRADRNPQSEQPRPSEKSPKHESVVQPKPKRRSYNHNR